MAQALKQKAAEEANGTRARSSNARARLLSTIPLTERTLDLAGVQTAVLEGGDGPPVVLLHGPGEYAAKWMRVIPDLAKNLPGRRARPAGAWDLGGGRWPDRRRSRAGLAGRADRAHMRDAARCSSGKSSAAPSRPASPAAMSIGSASWCLSTRLAWRPSSRRRSSGAP